MQVHTIIADSAADAVARIREQLGPQAVVVSVRPLPAEGLSKLWKKPRIEVKAAVPEAEPEAGSPAAPADPLAELRQELSALRAEVSRGRNDAAAPAPDSGASVRSVGGPAEPILPPFPVRSGGEPGSWRVGALLESTGLQAPYAQKIVEQLRVDHGDEAPAAIADEIQLASKVLQGEWRVPGGPAFRAAGIHVLVGPPGSGKTTALCKWVAQKALIENEPVSVWRLDGQTANTGELLSVYGEILGVPVERIVPEAGAPAGQWLFVDLPGVPWNEPAAVQELGRRVAQLPEAQIHLVLNLAYEAPVLLAQARAFASLPISDLILTHLDEETRWGKVWNLVLGTNYPVGWLGAGQNVPGNFVRAEPTAIVNRQFSRISA
jgi:flagellar biosynthesis protein FlhF